MNTKEIKEFLIDLVNQELEKEYDYRVDSDRDDTHIIKLISAKKYLIKNSKGLDTFVNNMILKEDVETYLYDLKKERW